MKSSLFLDIETNRNRELAFFNKSEQEIFRKIFLHQDRIAQLEKIAYLSRNKWSRIEAILSLGYCESPSLSDVFKKSLWDKDEDICYFSMIALAQTKTIDSAKILLDFLKQRPLYHHKIVSLLGQFPQGISAETARLLKDQDPSMRFLGLRILVGLKPQHLVKEVEALTSDTSGDVRSAACECLGDMRDRRSVVALLKCLEDDLWLVRASAVKALEQILGARSIPMIVHLIKDNSWLVIASVKKAIAKHIEDALPYMEKIFHGKDELAKKICVEIIETSGHAVHLCRNLLSENPGQKRQAVSIIDGILKSSPGYGLQVALNDLKSDERRAVLQIMQGINQECSKAMNQTNPVIK
ncbi:MAG: HEAT repeat domain-containing protein [Chlamydiae bacterium]|nr:HEAT repeat domain-containing protein [Chlamydiota bacterium]